MLTSWTYNEQTTKRQPRTGMWAAGVCVVSLSLSPSNFIGGTLGQRAANTIDSRQIRH